MRTAEALAQALLQTGRGVFLLTWRAKPELARALVVMKAALGGTAVAECLLATTELPPDLRRDLEERQRAESDSPASPLLLMFLGQTIGRTAGRTLNGWRRGLARDAGSVIVVNASEAATFCADAPDLASFLTGHRAEADAFLAVWSDATSKVLRKWVEGNQLGLPRALQGLPGDDVDLGELRQWLGYHLGAPAE